MFYLIGVAREEVVGALMRAEACSLEPYCHRSRFAGHSSEERLELRQTSEAG